jgi:hypothetical protein
MEVVTRHLHAAIKEIEPTQEEWMQGIQFLTATGHKCDDWRQEYILLFTCTKLPTASKQNGSLITGLASTTLSALTLPLISARPTPHTSTKRRYEKRHEHKPDAS